LSSNENKREEFDDLMMRSKILQKYSLASIAGLIMSVVGIVYAPNANHVLLGLLASIFALSAGLKLYFAFRWQKQARKLIGR